MFFFLHFLANFKRKTIIKLWTEGPTECFCLFLFYIFCDTHCYICYYIMCYHKQLMMIKLKICTFADLHSWKHEIIIQLILSLLVLLLILMLHVMVRRTLFSSFIQTTGEKQVLKKSFFREKHKSRSQSQKLFWLSDYYYLQQRVIQRGDRLGCLQIYMILFIYLFWWQATFAKNDTKLRRSCPKYVVSLFQLWQ